MALFDNLKQYEENGKKFTGVYYVEHPTRKHGVRRDRQLIIRYSVSGKRHTEVLGWLSDGRTPQEAQTKIKQFQVNAKAGLSPTSLAEERDAEAMGRESARQAAEAEERERKRKDITFDGYWTNTYFPDCEARKKRGSSQAEHYLYVGWIKPVVGHLRLLDIRPLHLRKLRENMAKAGKAPASVKYAYAVFQQVWNMARSDGYVSEESPTKDKTAKLPKLANGKERFLTPEEADLLLAGLRKVSPNVADMALLSLHSGLRAGEVFKLAWIDVDLAQGSLRLRDTKAGNARTVPLTATAKAMLESRLATEKAAKEKAATKGAELEPSVLVFPGRGGKQTNSISHTFDRVVDALGLNASVTDKRLRLTFHGLRHSCASLLVQSGVPLYTVSKILGHSTMRMTERYAHLAQDDLRHALGNVDTVLAKKAEAEQKAETA